MVTRCTCLAPRRRDRPPVWSVNSWFPATECREVPIGSTAVSRGGDHGNTYRDRPVDPQPDSGADRPAAMVVLPHPHGRGLGRGMDPRWPRDHGGQRRRRHIEPARDASPLIGRGGIPRHRLPGRRSGRGAVLRPPVRQTRSAQSLHGDARCLPGRQWPDRPDPGQRRRLGRVPLRHPVHRRNGHRWRVRGHQLGDRRTDSGTLSRPGRHRGERNLLGRCDTRHARDIRVPQVDGYQRGVATGLPHWSGARPGDPGGAAAPSGEPALAGDERPGGGR